jgi:hypothetical protein
LVLQAWLVPEQSVAALTVLEYLNQKLVLFVPVAWVVLWADSFALADGSDIPSYMTMKATQVTQALVEVAAVYLQKLADAVEAGSPCQASRSPPTPRCAQMPA